MKRKDRRKQNLCSRLDFDTELESTMSSGYDPFLSAGQVHILDKGAYQPEEPLISPTEWGMENNSGYIPLDINVVIEEFNKREASLLPADRSAVSSLDLCPTSDLYAEDYVDVNAILEMDLCDPVPLFLDDPTQENQDVFQDVRYTSTPKSRGLNTSGCNQADSNRKRPRFHVLHDITDSINCSNNESFININHVLDTTPPQSSHIIDSGPYVLPHLCTPPPTIPKKSEKQSPNLFGSGRKVSIIRKRLAMRQIDLLTPDATTSHAERTSTTAVNDEQSLQSQNTESLAMVLKAPTHRKVEDEEQLTYYSGIGSYDMCLALLKHIKLAPSKHLSTFKMQMIMLMKLRLDLQWKDIAFRYESREQIVRKVFFKTLNVFSECLIELLPWHLNKKNARKNSKAYLINAICKHDYQVVLVIGDGRKPVNFISNLYNKNEDPVAIILSECGSHLVKGDLISFDDSYFSVDEEDGRLCALQRISMFREPNMNYQQGVLMKMLSVYPLTSIEVDTDLCKVMKVVGALTNLNYMPSISVSTLKTIYERSANVCLNKRALKSV